MAFVSARFGQQCEPYPDSVYSVLCNEQGILAVAVFASVNDAALEFSLAAVPGRRWLTQEFRDGWFAYAFDSVGAKRLEASCHFANIDAYRMIKKLGFTFEGRKRCAAANGGDLLIFGMLRDECRFLKDTHEFPETERSAAS